MEYRLYYDENGSVVSYTCEEMPGNYILIDRSTFAQARPDVKVIDGKLMTKSNAIITKLKPSKSNGTLCSSHDISIVLQDTDILPAIKWETTRYELR